MRLYPAVAFDAAGRPTHAVTETFGFRTVEVRPQDGIYVNGTRVRLKGVNRHTFWPDAWRTTSRAVSELDAGAIGDNINKVLQFVNAAKSLIETAKNALPEAEKPIADTALEVANTISSLPSFDQLKGEIVALIDAVKASIQSLRA